MNTIKSVWLHLLVIFAAGFVLGAFCCRKTPATEGPTPAQTNVRDVQASTSTKNETKSDSTKESVRTRIVYVQIPGAEAINVPGIQIAPDDPRFSLQFTIPDLDSTGYYTIWLDSIDCAGRIIKSIRTAHSKKAVMISDTNIFVSHAETNRDSSTSSHIRDSSATSAQHGPLFSLLANFSSPVFQNGVIGFAPLETTAGLTLRASLGEVMQVGIRPELPVLNPFRFKDYRINCDLSFEIWHSR